MKDIFLHISIWTGIPRSQEPEWYQWAKPTFMYKSRKNLKIKFLWLAMLLERVTCKLLQNPINDPYRFEQLLLKMLLSLDKDNMENSLLNDKNDTEW